MWTRFDVIVPATSLTISPPTVLLHLLLQPLWSPCSSSNIARMLLFEGLGTYVSSAGRFFSLGAYFCSSIFWNGAHSKRYNPVPFQKKKKKKPLPIPSYSNPLNLALYFFWPLLSYDFIYMHICIHIQCIHININTFIKT